MSISLTETHEVGTVAASCQLATFAAHAGRLDFESRAGRSSIRGAGFNARAN
jgi:hypothetical protein